ncbi:hypothetical protein [Leuconostoc citreum]|uniref:hypothetical protein n=1 Tax=Leuconostoc citreum TaxID=33964 RepID=UPI00186B7EF7|nr:hypothetical protein [Leuconostoc citreum]MBE4726278.1 hypothetical protein [Leuconostoc citreum]
MLTKEQFEVALAKMDQKKLHDILEKMDREIREIDFSSDYRAATELAGFSLYINDELKTTTSRTMQPKWTNLKKSSQMHTSPAKSLVKTFVSRLSDNYVSDFVNPIFLDNKNSIGFNNDDELSFAS